jgi:hypothetical protein
VLLEKEIKELEKKERKSFGMCVYSIQQPGGGFSGSNQLNNLGDIKGIYI